MTYFCGDYTEGLKTLLKTLQRTKMPSGSEKQLTQIKAIEQTHIALHLSRIADALEKMTPAWPVTSRISK